MSQIPRVILTTPLPRMASVEAVDGLVVRVLWSFGIREGRSDDVDLSPLINSRKYYRPLRDDPKLFSTVHLIERGTIIAWGSDDRIDMAADSVEQLAEETLTVGDFKAFLSTNSLTHQEAAALLGRSRRQLENYLSGERIPRVVALACFGLKERKRSRESRMTVNQIDPGTQVSSTDTRPTSPLNSDSPNATSISAVVSAAVL
jgi:hypothetical protein